ncbi:unnamed protein product, partial [Mesorhabditis belari]|uniref:Fungal lipase-like domain-containing protein n=1 Tax=Mesorhabditis belari TaxID=2138241 RepID=A0AAF3F0S9_9BILA
MHFLLLAGFFGFSMAMPFDQAEIRTRDRSKYSDDFARNTFFPLAMGAYESDPQACVTSGIQGKVKRLINVQCDVDKKDTCAGFTASSDSLKAIVLAFRGTSRDSQLVIEILDAIKEMTPFGGGGVAYYFYKGFMSVWNGGLKDDFLTLRQQYPDYEIWVTGHSLGASMAAIAADYLAINYKPDMTKFKLMTFGEPRTGNASYATAHDARLPFSFRVVHNHDIVPQLPFQWMGYHHHSVEVWYPNKMAVGQPFKICAQQEDQSCQDGQLDVWIPDHDDYFDIADDWVGKGCPRK